MKQLAYTAPQLFTGETWLKDHAMLVNDGTIEALLPLAELDANNFDIKRWDDGFLAPAFIDIQIYGAKQQLLSAHPSAQALQALADACLEGGTTLCLPTIATNTIEVFYQCIDAVKKYWATSGRGIYGLHLEGPWINAEKRGAHLEAYVKAPELAEVKALLAYGKGVIKMITLAPEVCTHEVIDAIQSEGIIISAGHSNATYAQATAAFNKGITTATHLYNAMSGLQHRQPGMVGALFNHASAMCSIIPDGHHVDYAAVAIAKKAMGERLFVITDAVTETYVGPYRHQFEGDKYVSDGILSGSALSMHAAFKNLVTHVNIPVDEALRMCSLYPAKVLGQQNVYGKLLPGYRAGAIVLNSALDLLSVING